MKKRDKKLSVSRETIRDLTVSGSNAEQLLLVLGGSCIPGASTHCSNVCVTT
jgi:hypothetical protein